MPTTDPVTWDEIDTAMNEVFQKNDPMQGLAFGMRIDQGALKIMQNTHSKLAPGNKPFDMARFWFAVGLLVGENRHNKSKIILPYA